MDLEIRIRPAKPEDAEKLLAIYAPYVEQTALSQVILFAYNADFFIKSDRKDDSGWKVRRFLKWKKI